MTAFPLWIISVTNCSLFISALVLDEESKLPLLDALHTWNLLWLLPLSTSTSATAKTFNECLNTITSTIFIWSVPLLPGRVIALVSSIIATCIYIAILARRAQWIISQLLQSTINPWIPNADHDHDPSSPLPRLVPHFKRHGNSPWTNPFAAWSYLDDDHHRIGIMSLGKVGLGMTVWVYMVVSNEFLLKENHAVDAYVFDFAQYNALFAAFPAAFAVFTVFYKPRSATNNYDDTTSDTLTYTDLLLARPST
ncbi:hypothetical protein EV359DRAFT_67290 [Lentinula novae-zelandiae]|nr:hypothetical protein EV359DRAFT_67290 [Lentinula novae-zelandiae]